jgi:hypothetical protein
VAWRTGSGDRAGVLGTARTVQTPLITPNDPLCPAVVNPITLQCPAMMPVLLIRAEMGASELDLPVIVLVDVARDDPGADEVATATIVPLVLVVVPAELLAVAVVVPVTVPDVVALAEPCADDPDKPVTLPLVAADLDPDADTADTPLIEPVVAAYLDPVANSADRPLIVPVALLLAEPGALAVDVAEIVPVVVVPADEAIEYACRITRGRSMTKGSAEIWAISDDDSVVANSATCKILPAQLAELSAASKPSVEIVVLLVNVRVPLHGEVNRSFPALYCRRFTLSNVMAMVLTVPVAIDTPSPVEISVPPSSRSVADIPLPRPDTACPIFRMSLPPPNGRSQ